MEELYQELETLMFKLRMAQGSCIKYYIEGEGFIITQAGNDEISQIIEAGFRIEVTSGKARAFVA